jgi:hypothetical protein
MCFTDVSLTRLRMGFDIAEVIEALLLCKEAVLPVVWKTHPRDSAEACEAVAQLDTCLRHMIGRFGHLYAEAMHHSLKEQQRRMALMLEAAQTASGSLELDQVLRRVAQGIAAAVGVRYCGIYLMDEERGVLVPRTSTGDLTGPRLDAFRTLCLDPATDPLVREVVERKEPVVSYDAQSDPRVSRETAQALGVRSVLAVPIEVGGRVLGMAVVGVFGDCCTFTSEQIELAWGIANAVALAGGRGKRWAGGASGSGETPTRRDPDGPGDAGDGRDRGHSSHHGPAAGGAHPGADQLRR